MKTDTHWWRLSHGWNVCNVCVLPNVCSHSGKPNYNFDLWIFHGRKTFLTFIICSHSLDNIHFGFLKNYWKISVCKTGATQKGPIQFWTLCNCWSVNTSWWSTQILNLRYPSLRVAQPSYCHVYLVELSRSCCWLRVHRRRMAILWVVLSLSMS